MAISLTCLFIIHLASKRLHRFKVNFSYPTDAYFFFFHCLTHELELAINHRTLLVKDFDETSQWYARRMLIEYQPFPLPVCEGNNMNRTSKKRKSTKVKFHKTHAYNWQTLHYYLFVYMKKENVVKIKRKKNQTPFSLITTTIARTKITTKKGTPFICYPYFLVSQWHTSINHQRKTTIRTFAFPTRTFSTKIKIKSSPNPSTCCCNLF